MASLNPFDLLGDDDAEDPSLLLAAQKKAAALASAPGQPKKGSAQSQPAVKPSAKLPSKPIPSSEFINNLFCAVKESRNEGQRGGRGGRGFNRELVDNENTFGNSNGFSGGYRPSEDGDSGKAPSERRPYNGPRGGGGFRSGRRGGFSNGESEEGGERPRRMFERRSGTGRGTEVKREGAGRGNWGTPNDEVVP
ncbi:hypothetical protein PHJA_002691400 [Phtheirospermum japonicum]|uniref:Hyaluronan/mRNA-binding protein domain-containing protein n=1 Tax=Phtheirospermum japonicum TaxID=374723 RepID=A0A830D4A6_9LAMI|nr:hypothetical protein PHJA_002691400 [Phtheirospermum japonicum]